MLLPTHIQERRMNTSRERLSFLLCVLIGGLVLFGSETTAQTELEKAIQQYGSATVGGYMQPVADLFGANMHAGYYHSAYIPTSGFSIGIDLIGMGALVQDGQKTYEATAPAGFSPATFKTATIFGGKGGSISHATIAGLQYKGSDGVFNTSIFPLAVPQLRIGSLYGTEVVLRFIATPSIGDNKFPVLTFWGAGVRHSISQYIPQSPVDIAASFFYSNFALGDLVKANGTSFGVQASKSIKILMLYGGLAWEKSTLDLSYKSSDPTAAPMVDVSLNGANKFRFTVGVGVSLGILKIFADANFGTVTNYSGGIGFGR
jgi:hypothetical protein